MALPSAPKSIGEIQHRCYKFLKTPLGWLVIAIVVSLLLIAICAALVAWTPGWYNPLPSNSKRVFNLADSAERELMRLRNEVGNPGRHQVVWSITQDQINSLLAVRYPTSSAPAPKSGLAGPFIMLSRGRITLAIRDYRLPFHSVASVCVRIHTSRGAASKKNSPPDARIQLDSVHIGLIPIPRSNVLGALHQRLTQFGPLIRSTLARYAGSRYARAQTPRILKYIQNAMRGKPFPLTLQAGGRTLELARISIRGAYGTAAGVEKPARIKLTLDQIAP